MVWAPRQPGERGISFELEILGSQITIIGKTRNGMASPPAGGEGIESELEILGSQNTIIGNMRNGMGSPPARLPASPPPAAKPGNQTLQIQPQLHNFGFT